MKKIATASTPSCLSLSAKGLSAVTSSGVTTRPLDTSATLLGLGWRPDGAEMLLCGERGAVVAAAGGAVRTVDSGTRDNLVGPFWSPSRDAPLAVMLKGPDEKVYTV